MERGDRGFVAVGGVNARALGKPQRERADAGEQIGDIFGVRARGEDEPRQRGLAGDGRLQERRRRQVHDRPADAHGRHPALRHHFAVAGQPGEVALLRHLRQRRGERRREGAGAANVDIEPGVRRRDVNIERLHRGSEHLGDRPGRLDSAAEPRRQHRTSVDRDQAVGAGGGEADLQHFVRAAPGMQDGAAAAVAMGIDQIADRRLEPGLLQRFDDETALPGAVTRRLPMLDGAAAAHAEMRTDRRNALRARRLDAQQMPPVGMAGDRLDLDRFARQRAGHINRAVRAFGNPVAAVADLFDHKVFGHPRPSLPTS